MVAAPAAAGPGLLPPLTGAGTPPRAGGMTPDSPRAALAAGSLRVSRVGSASSGLLEQQRAQDADGSTSTPRSRSATEARGTAQAQPPPAAAGDSSPPSPGAKQPLRPGSSTLPAMASPLAVRPAMSQALKARLEVEVAGELGPWRGGTPDSTPRASPLPPPSPQQQQAKQQQGKRQSMSQLGRPQQAKPQQQPLRGSPAAAAAAAAGRGPIVSRQQSPLAASSSAPEAAASHSRIPSAAARPQTGPSFQVVNQAPKSRQPSPLSGARLPPATLAAAPTAAEPELAPPKAEPAVAEPPKAEPAAASATTYTTPVADPPLVVARSALTPASPAASAPASPRPAAAATPPLPGSEASAQGLRMDGSAMSTHSRASCGTVPMSTHSRASTGMGQRLPQHAPGSAAGSPGGLLPVHAPVLDASQLPDRSRPPKVGFLRRKVAAKQAPEGEPAPYQRRFTEPPPPPPPPTTLDAALLLQVAKGDAAGEVEGAKLRSRGICDAAPAGELQAFTALRHLDLADNQLPGLFALAPLPSLQHLSLAANRLRGLGPLPAAPLPAQAFLQLASLSLAYNLMDAAAVLGPASPLAALPRLRELDLTANGLRALPDTLGAFVALQVLRLDRNQLQSGCLVPLAQLPALQHLALSQNHITEVPEGVGGSGSSGDSSEPPYPCLQSLNLAHNRIATGQALQPLAALQHLRTVVLEGNPVLSAAGAAAEAPTAAATVPITAAAVASAATASALQPHGPQLSFSTLGFEVLAEAPEAAPLVAPRLGEFLHHHGVTVAPSFEELRKDKALLAAAHAAIANTPHEKLVQLFGRVDNMLQEWQLNPVPEEGKGQEEEEEQPYQDNTFLTGVGIAEEGGNDGDQADRDQGPAEAEQPPLRPLWMEVEEPTERMALALGLDPSSLAIHDGHVTGDSAGAIRALRYALSHGLVGLDEGLAPDQHHTAMTASIRAKRVERKLPPLEGELATLGASSRAAKVKKIATLETMLDDMKGKLGSLEAMLAKHLTESGAAPPATGLTAAAAALPVQARVHTGGEADSEEEEGEASGGRLVIGAEFGNAIGGASDSADYEEEEGSEDGIDAASEGSSLPNDTLEALEADSSDEDSPRDRAAQHQQAEAEQAAAATTTAAAAPLAEGLSADDRVTAARGALGYG